MRRSLVVSLAVLAIVRSQAAAQTCQGLASYSAGQLQVAANAQFPEGGKVWGGSLSYGLPSGIFGGADLQTTSINNDGGSSLGIGAHAGYQMKLGRSGKMALCPVARLALGMGPDAEAGNSSVDNSQTDIHVGFALGTEMGASQQMRILPTAGLGLQYSKLKTEITGPGAGTEEFSDTYALARLGVGFVFNQQISVRPTVDIPVGLEGSDPVFGLSVGYNFGSKGAAKARRH
jgi:Outer membrane protein beta-barrel domain